MSAAPPFTAPMVCRFIKHGCQHPDLFQETYQRANRAHGIKIMRCFPHCCPFHMPRSYCGGSIDLQIDGCGVPASQLRVFARFRPLDDDDASLRVGDRVEKATIESGVQSETNPSGEWIASSLRLRRGLVHMTHSSLGFVLSPTGRWYYSWQSGKRNSKRLTKHVLEGIVFTADPCSDHLRVVASVKSPAFTVISFRRVAGLDELRSTGWSPYDTFEYEYPTRQQARPDQQVTAVNTSAPIEEPSLNRFMEALGAVYHTAKMLSVGSSKFLIPVWSQLVGDDALSMDRAPTITIAVASSLTTSSSVIAAASLVWWLALDQETQQSWSRCVASAAEYLVKDPKHMRQVFDEWTRWLQKHIDQFLSQLGGLSLGQLTKCESTYTSHPFDWRSFVAQSREEIVGHSLRQRVGISKTSTVWMCPFRNISVCHSTEELGRALDELSITSVFAFWQQLSCIEISLDTRKAPPELVIASTRNRISHSRTLRLTLDNQYRWFNALPSGISTLSDSSSLSHLFGDYIGNLREDGTLEVTMFSWSSSNQTDVPRRWLWQFQKQHLLNDHLEVNVSVAIGQRGPHSDDLACQSIQDKLKLIRSWNEDFRAQLSYKKVSTKPAESSHSFRI